MNPQDVPSAPGLAVATDEPHAPTVNSAPTTTTAAAGDSQERPATREVNTSPWRAVVVQSGAIWLMTRLAYLAYTYYALTMRYQSQVNRGRLSHISVPSSALLTSWGNAGGAWYLAIARQGYSTPQAAPYFPLYPLLIKLVSVALGSHALVAGLLVANLGSLGAFIALGLLVAYETQRQGAAPREMSSAISRTLLAFAAYPLAFLLVATYSDGVALALIFAALLCARRRAWRWAALWAALAGLAQPLAIILVAPLLWEYGRQRGWFIRPVAQAGRAPAVGAASAPVETNAASRGGDAWIGALAVVAAPLTVALYLSFVQLRFGDPLLAFGTVSAAGHVSDFLAPAGSFAQGRALADLALVVIAMVLTLVAVRRAPVAYTLFMAGLLLVCLTTGGVTGSDPALNAGRILLAAAPCFLLLGRWMERRPWLDLLVVGGGFTLQAICALLFLWGGWVA